MRRSVAFYTTVLDFERTPGDPDAPTEVHEGPIGQSWGTREFYVDDPDGNTIRFVQ